MGLTSAILKTVRRVFYLKARYPTQKNGEFDRCVSMERSSSKHVVCAVKTAIDLLLMRETDIIPWSCCLGSYRSNKSNSITKLRREDIVPELRYHASANPKPGYPDMSMLVCRGLRCGGCRFNWLAVRGDQQIQGRWLKRFRLQLSEYALPLVRRPV